MTISPGSDLTSQFSNSAAILRSVLGNSEDNLEVNDVAIEILNDICCIEKTFLLKEKILIVKLLL